MPGLSCLARGMSARTLSSAESRWVEQPAPLSYDNKIPRTLLGRRATTAEPVSPLFSALDVHNMVAQVFSTTGLFGKGVCLLWQGCCSNGEPQYTGTKVHEWRVEPT